MGLMEKNLVNLCCDAKNKTEVLEHLTRMVWEAGRITSRALFLEELIRREVEAPTDIGFSVAIPHGKTDAVKEASLLFLRLQEPIVWNEDKVHLIFGIAVPKTETTQLHLQMLSRICRKIVSEEFLQQLDEASTAEEIIQLVL